MKNTIKKLLPFFYKVECPICKSRFRKFATYGLDVRLNAQCWNCGSLERHRLVFKYIQAKTNLISGNTKLKLLHFAPEPFFHSMFSDNKNIEYTPCDLTPEAYPYSSGVKMKKVDITNITFKDGTFDAIICIDVLEHIPDDRLAMSELYRVMNKSGWSILTVPIRYDLEKTYEDFSITDPAERIKAFGRDDHVRYYGRDYKDRLASVGFNVKEEIYTRTFSDHDIYKYGLRESDRVYFCT